MSPVNGKLEVIQEGLRFLEEEEHDLSVYRDRQAVKYKPQESIETCRQSVLSGACSQCRSTVIKQGPRIGVPMSSPSPNASEDPRH